MQSLISVHLNRVAHARSGDKGNRSNIGLIAWRPEFYACLVEQITEDVVRRQFEHRNPSQVRRYLLPKLGAMNFVIDDVLEGGVNSALNLDSHGKTLSFLLLDLKIRIPADWLNKLQGPSAE